ncbi:uncharacterized protein CELE_T01G5.6 [Caenorhabditis elegans]|uniref:Secreted protein n=1 Tax=Caenorhabditis elegans TaxID=6239 RepID=O18011_CAEEL|nr:Secreted protein [Caenorhabditis elegans]CAB03268.1 Secreted protein [Caenorhabditis elegans]|eukprot:NP_506727.1 Uncharacterized protein CELE_T01G5.6 [Caenorhabditis elegans]
MRAPLLSHLFARFTGRARRREGYTTSKKLQFKQITTPTFCRFSPIAFVVSVPYFDLEISVPTGIFVSSFNLYPALDAFILMYVLTDYRNALKRKNNVFFCDFK